MIKKVENHINSVLQKSFKEFKDTVNFSESSKKTITDFIEVFIKNLNKKINLEKAHKSSKNKESELISDIEGLLLMSSVNGSQRTIQDCKDRIKQFKLDK